MGRKGGLAKECWFEIQIFEFYDYFMILGGLWACCRYEADAGEWPRRQESNLYFTLRREHQQLEKLIVPYALTAIKYAILAKMFQICSKFQLGD